MADINAIKQITDMWEDMEEQAAKFFGYKDWDSFEKEMKSTGLQVGEYRCKADEFDQVFYKDNYTSGEDLVIDNGMILVPYISSGHSEDSAVVATHNLTLLGKVFLTLEGAKLYKGYKSRYYGDRVIVVYEAKLILRKMHSCFHRGTFSYRGKLGYS